jgi:hypothetical protein
VCIGGSGAVGGAQRYDPGTAGAEEDTAGGPAQLTLPISNFPTIF